MISKVEKRNGEKVDFQKEKIEKAVFKALTSSRQGNGSRAKEIADKVFDLILRRFSSEEVTHVEQIQDIVEEVLIMEDLPEVAKAYIIYREKRREIREAIAEFDESTEIIDKYIGDLDWEVKENANMTYSLQGLNQYATSHISKKYWLNKIYPEYIRKAAKEQDFHIHDLNLLSTYCCGWDIQDLLLKGFGGVPSKVESKPPKHFRSALGQVVNFFFTLQGECYSEDTKVLTKEGWKKFPEVSLEEEIYTLNIEKKEVEMQKPVNFYQFDHDDKLFNFKGEGLDLLVTKNHNMLVSREGEMTFLKAKDFNLKTDLIPKGGKNVEEPPILVEVEEIKEVDYKGKVYCLEVPNHTLYVKREGKEAWCGNSAGAQAMSNVDTFLAPFIKKDNLNYKQVKQAIQEFVFNCMVPTRVGFQTPFINISLDVTVPQFLKDQPVILGGEYLKETYGEFQEEMNIFNKAFYEVLMEGDSKGRVFTFPIPTISITKDFDWENPVLDKMWEATAKYGISYFSNFVQSDMNPEDFRSMCCRLRLDNTELIKRGGGLFGSQPLTGSVGVVTINLPRIGYLSKTRKEYFDRLGEMMDIAKDSLEIKRKVLNDFIEKGLYPYTRHYLSSVKELRGSYFGNHFSTIGLVGANESLLNFLGEDITTKKGKKFALEVLEFMRERLKKYQEETGNLYNLEATPGEGASFRQARIDKEKYPDIITAGTKEAPYYTNSVHPPVGFSDDPFQILDLQDELQTAFTGGTVIHLFLGERASSPQAAKSLVKKVFENYHLPYITLTPTFSICPVCGYLKGEKYYCPSCKIEKPNKVVKKIK